MTESLERCDGPPPQGEKRTQRGTGSVSVGEELGQASRASSSKGMEHGVCKSPG